MATLSDVRSVKSLNTSDDSRRFVFKTISQRIEEININVYRSLDPLKDEPSEGSTFFRDGLVEYRELNTAEDFISFYEEFFPLVQTLPQIILQKDLIISSLLDRLKLAGRLSLEPILRLIAVLSRDLLGDFTLFLQQIVDSFDSLLASGADKDPEIIEQIFTSWSYIMMFMQKYLVKDVDHVLRITAKLRYYPKDYVREFMAESVSFLLRKASDQQREKGVMKLMAEVVEEPSEIRKSAVGALLSHVMRITSSSLHSRTETLLPLLVDGSFLQISDQSVEGSPDSEPVLKVLVQAFGRLYSELDPVELSSIWKFLMDKIKDSVTNGNSIHLSRLLTMLISIVENDYLRKITDFEPFVELVGLHVQTFITPNLTMETFDTHSEVIEKVLQLILCTIDGLFSAKNMLVLLRVTSEWGPVFEIRSRSLLTFIGDLLLKHHSIIHAFGTDIIRALNNLIESSDEEVVYLMVKFCEKLEEESSSFFNGKPKETFPKIFNFFEETLQYWIGKISEAVFGNIFPIEQNRLAVLWAVMQCYSHFADAHGNPLLLMELINAIDKLLLVEFSFPHNFWYSLVGAALRSYHKIVFRRGIVHEESAVIKFLDLARRYKLSPQILSAVADILDSVSFDLPDVKCQIQFSEFMTGKFLDALNIFAENLSHTNKEIRLSTLRILCHYERMHDEHLKIKLAVDNNSGVDTSETSLVGGRHNNVLDLLRSIEETALSVATSRKVELLLSKIPRSLSRAHEVADQYMLVILNGIIGLLHNQLKYVWEPALQCLTGLIRQYSQIVWDSFVKYLEQCLSDFLAWDDRHGRGNDDSNKDTGLVGCFYSDVFPVFDRTPCGTMLSRLIQSLREEEVLPIVESHSRQIVPLFLKYLGYDVNIASVASHGLDHKGKKWEEVLSEWLSLFRLFHNPKAFYQSQVLRDVLQYRLLDQCDADLQMKVLDCLLKWRDDFLVPYKENLKNLIDAKNLREELARWSLCRTSDGSIEVRHRAYIVPIVIRILIPKVRNVKMLSCQKNANIRHRRAVLGYIAQLDADELPLFFWLLFEPLLPISQRGDETSKSFWSSPQSPKFDADPSDILKHFTSDTIKALPWEKLYGFMHVIGDVLAVFDENHLNPFLNLLMNCVVRISANCTSSLGSRVVNEHSSVENHSNIDSEVADHDELEDKMKGRKKFRDFRSFCFQIIYLVLKKYKDHDFGGAFWDLFFTSVKPLIAKQEGGSSKKRKRDASSEKSKEGDMNEEPCSLFYSLGANNKEPSSLFFCFLAMSKSYDLVPLLSREGNLVPDIFSTLRVPSASDSFLRYVLKFIKNLLKLDNELGNKDNSIKNVLLPHLDELIKSLHFLFTDKKSSKRNLVKFPGRRELTIFNLLAKYVKEPSRAKTFIDMMLPLLTKKHQNLDTCVDVLQIIRQVVTFLGSASSKEILNSITPLLISADLAIRNSICDVLDAVAANDSSLCILAKVLRELNATSKMEMGGRDYDKIAGAYKEVNVNFFNTIQEEHALPILAHAVHDMSSEESSLRQSAFSLLLSFIEFSCKILNGSLKSDKKWSEAGILHIVNKFFLRHMGNAMEKEVAVKREWINLLREMVLTLPEKANLDSYRVLCSDDAEQDFFKNIIHIQKHRRARALLSRFCTIVNSKNLSEVITYEVFVPLLFSMLFDAQDGKDEHIKSASMDALGSISGCMEWNQYYALLLRCFRDLILKPVKQKLLLRLICSILDHFHFRDSSSVHEAKVSSSVAPDPYTINKNPLLTLRKCSSGTSDDMQECLQNKLFPKIQKLLTTDSDKVNVNSSLVALKLLKLLPAEVMDSQLPTIVHRISNFLKNRLESVRDEARSALSACLKELGLEYLQFIVKVLKGTLKRGFELHVLGYTLNFLLSKFLSSPICGKLDYCLDDVLSIAVNDILGDVSEEKEVEKIASKMKETRKQKSYETLKLIAQSITFKTHAMKLLSSVTVHLHTQINQKTKLKLESMLSHIADGIVCNPSVKQTDLFIFIKDGINDEGNEHVHSSVSRAGKLDRDAEGVQKIQANRLVKVDPRLSHLITVFALRVLQNYMKKLKPNKHDEQLLRNLDPFVSLLGKCLCSKYENIVTAALRCLSLLVGLRLPSLQSQADEIKNSLLVIAQGSLNTSSQMTESCMKLLTRLLQLRRSRVTLSADQLRMLIQFPMFVDFAKNPSFVALKLLKAIVQRKLKVPEIYGLVQIVAELMVQSQDEPIRKMCSKVLLQFLLGYDLPQKCLQQHFDFLLANLRYEHSTGREAVLEMLRSIILKFPQKFIDAQCQTLFVYLVTALANDDDKNVRSMSAAAIKCLIGHVSKHSLQSILEFSMSWYLGGKQSLWGAAAQVLGLLVETIGKGFQAHLSGVLPVMRRIFQSAISAVTSSSQRDSSDDAVFPYWEEAYYSLVMLEKILGQFHNMFLDKELEDIWETICELLLHPHLRLRNVSCRILASYFSRVTVVCKENCEVSAETFFLVKPSILFHIAVSLCCQLKGPSTDEAAGIVTMQNLVSSICRLQSLLDKNETMDASTFWSSLDRTEQDRFLKAFSVLDPRKGKRNLDSLISDAIGQHSKHQHPFISYLLQRLAKITFHMEVTQMKIVFNCYKSISPELLGCYSPSTGDGLHSYAYQLLLPLYRVCEGYAGKVITDDLNQFAQEVLESIRGIIGVQNFVQIYNEIGKNVKAKRDKRKQKVKMMAVDNPARNAKRKLRNAAKHRDHKKRKIMTMRMGRWIHMGKFAV